LTSATPALGKRACVSVEAPLLAQKPFADSRDSIVDVLAPKNVRSRLTKRALALTRADAYAALASIFTFRNVSLEQ
jgi:hypothetical protein